MADLEKVIKGLECCNSPNNHEDCPYNGEAHYNICTHKLLADAISLLKAQETEIIEEDAYTFQKALVGKYLINKKHIGTRIDSVLDVSVPVRLLSMEEQDATD